MKKYLIFFILITVVGECILSVDAQIEAEPLHISIELTPETPYSQIILGETYFINVKVENHALRLREDDIIDPVNNSKFTGNIVMYIAFKVNKDGNNLIGNERQRYVVPLEAWEDNYNFILPPVGSFDAMTFSYMSNRGYDPQKVKIDEWITFNIDVKFYLWQYREDNGGIEYHLGELVGESHKKFYVVSNSKIYFVTSLITAMGEDILDANDMIRDMEDELGLILRTSLTNDQAKFEELTEFLEAGDYVSALYNYEEYQLNWKDDLANELKGHVATLVPLMANYTQQFEQLTQEYQTLQTEYRISLWLIRLRLQISIPDLQI